NAEQDEAAHAVEHGADGSHSLAPLAGRLLELDPVGFTAPHEGIQLFEVHGSLHPADRLCPVTPGPAQDVFHGPGVMEGENISTLSVASSTALLQRGPHSAGRISRSPP